MSSNYGTACESKDRLGPFVLSEKTDDCRFPEDECVLCMLCEEKFSQDKAPKDYLLKHLLTVHKLVIGDVHLIANLTRYVTYWKKKFKDKPLEEFCSVIKTNTLENDIAPQENFFLLSDLLPEDKELRDQLQQEKLTEVLNQQQRERSEETFSRGCLFCRQHFEGNRAELFNHMVQEHNFSVGQPDNLVYTSEFLDVLQEKLESCICLYCEKIFKDRFVLKEHMRKKGHKKINPKNKMYDKFYIVNYLELGKNWEVIQSEDDDDKMSSMSQNEDWSDWLGDGGDLQSVCLFCDTKTESPDSIAQHMKDCHRFDLASIKNELHLTFYQQVKLINYIRRQIHQNICMSCQEKCVSRGALLQHWEETDHIGQIPALKEWDQPQYYFPTYEDDNLLCGLDDEATDAPPTGETGNLVIAEELPDKQTLLRESSVLSELVLS